MEEIGHVAFAKDVFDSILIKERDEICICAIMKCLINNGMNSDALTIYNEYDDESKDDVLHLFAIKASINCNNKRMHSFIQCIL